MALEWIIRKALMQLKVEHINISAKYRPTLISLNKIDFSWRAGNQILHRAEENKTINSSKIWILMIIMISFKEGTKEM
jgi:hypothetical protein